MYFTCSKFSSGNLADILAPTARLFNADTGEELCNYAFDGDPADFASHTAVVMCCLLRDGPNWALKALGEMSQGRVSQDDDDDEDDKNYEPLRQRISRLSRAEVYRGPGEPASVPQRPRYSLAQGSGMCRVVSVIRDVEFKDTRGNRHRLVVDQRGDPPEPELVWIVGNIDGREQCRATGPFTWHQGELSGDKCQVTPDDAGLEQLGKCWVLRPVGNVPVHDLSEDSAFEMTEEEAMGRTIARSGTEWWFTIPVPWATKFKKRWDEELQDDEDQTNAVAAASCVVCALAAAAEAVRRWERVAPASASVLCLAGSAAAAAARSNIVSKAVADSLAAQAKPAAKKKKKKGRGAAFQAFINESG